MSVAYCVGVHVSSVNVTYTGDINGIIVRDGGDTHVGDMTDLGILFVYTSILLILVRYSSFLPFE